MTDRIQRVDGAMADAGRGPHPGSLAIVTLGLTVAGVVALSALSGGRAAASPFIDAGDLLARYAQNTDAVRAGAFLQFAAAVPLGILTATLQARLVRLGVRVPGPGIAFYGGSFASVMLGVSALVAWVLSQPDVLVDAATVKAFATLSFALGAQAYAVGIGLLVAGVAVPAHILHLLPRWLTVSGVLIAALAELSFVGLIWDPMQVLVPVARFGGGLWLVAAGFVLPSTRARRGRA